MLDHRPENGILLADGITDTELLRARETFEPISPMLEQFGGAAEFKLVRLVTDNADRLQHSRVLLVISPVDSSLPGQLLAIELRRLIEVLRGERNEIDAGYELCGRGHDCSWYSPGGSGGGLADVIAGRRRLPGDLGAGLRTGELSRLRPDSC